MVAIKEVLGQIRQGILSPLYVFYGEERWLIDEALRLLREQLTPQGESDFNYERFDLTEEPIERALESAESFTLMGEKRLIVAFGATFLCSGREKDKVEHNLEALEKYVENPAPHSVFCLVVHHPKLDERKKIVRSLKNHAVVAEAEPLKSGEILSWIKERGRERGVIIQDEAAALLQQFMGESLSQLDLEIAKLASYAGRGNEVTEEVVLALTSETAERNVFQLVNEVVEQKVTEAFRTLHNLLKRNEEPIKILFLLARQFRLMYEAKRLAQGGWGEKELARVMGVHPYVAKLVLKQSRRFSVEELELILNRLADLDYEMKTGQVDKALALELFILQSMKTKKVSM